MRDLLHQIGDVVTDARGRAYRIIGILGEGNSAVTYAAEDTTQPELTVALKAFSFQQTSDWKMWELFEREAKVLAQLQHPSIPRYLDSFYLDTENDRRFYIAQELAVGKSLAAWVEEGWRSNEGTVREIAQQILEILIYLQKFQPPVIHRDIKPQNIIRDENGKLFLVDFGAVRDTYYSTLMRGSTVVGTYGYMAPEQFRAQALPATDLYGLGATLLFLLTHRSPAELPMDGLAVDFRGRIKVSNSLANWLEKMLEPDANQRFKSAQAALIALLQKQKLAGQKQTLFKPSEAIIAAILVTLAAFWLGESFKWKIWSTFGFLPSNICGDINVLQDYLKKGGNPNARTFYVRPISVAGSSEYPLLFCASQKAAEILLKYGANPNIQEKGEPILCKAIDDGDIELIKLLLKHGANPNGKVTIPLSTGPDYNFSVLHRAIDKGQKEIVKILINSGANINEKNSSELTALDIAVARNQIEIGQLLLAKGAIANRYSKFERLHEWRQGKFK